MIIDVKPNLLKGLRGYESTWTLVSDLMYSDSAIHLFSRFLYFLPSAVNSDGHGEGIHTKVSTNMGSSHVWWCYDKRTKRLLSIVLITIRRWKYAQIFGLSILLFFFPSSEVKNCYSRYMFLQSTLCPLASTINNISTWVIGNRKRA